MKRPTNLICVIALLLLASPLLTRGAEPGADPLQFWRQNVTIHPVSAAPDRHTIHSYYLTTPESPDGKRVLFYTSTTPEAHHGDLCVLDRATGIEKTIARNLETEDAHRAACQQWTADGRLVAFHDVRNDKGQARWGVYVVDAETAEQRPLALDRQLAFGVPTADTLPLYGCHWKPGEHTGLELANATTGEIRIALTIDAVRQRYGHAIAKIFGDKTLSIFFPILSPDGRRVFFKLSAPSGSDDFRSKAASAREVLIAYDLAEQRFLFLRTKWGHPAWNPDCRRIIEVGNVWLDALDEGRVTRIPDLPVPPGCHLAVSPDGLLFVMDGSLEKLGGKPGEWGIFVCDARGGGADRYQILYRFDQTKGATSWRRNHPHPVFSPDGKRIYFNVNDTKWTRLFVAECAPTAQ